MNELIALFGLLGFLGGVVALVALWSQRDHDKSTNYEATENTEKNQSANNRTTE